MVSYELATAHGDQPESAIRHRHIGPTDRLAPADPPSLSQVLSEIEG